MTGGTLLLFESVLCHEYHSRFASGKTTSAGLVVVVVAWWVS